MRMPKYISLKLNDQYVFVLKTRNMSRESYFECPGIQAICSQSLILFPAFKKCDKDSHYTLNMLHFIKNKINNKV